MSSLPMSRLSLTLIGAGLGLAVSASVFTAQVLTQKFMPPEWCLLLLGGTTGTGAIVGRMSDRRPGSSFNSQVLTTTPIVLPDGGNQGLFTETCTTIAHHLCQVPTGTEEYQEALIAGAATTVNLRSALVGEPSRSRWQDAVSRWQAASVTSGQPAVDAITGRTHHVFKPIPFPGGRTPCTRPNALNTLRFRWRFFARTPGIPLQLPGFQSLPRHPNDPAGRADCGRRWGKLWGIQWQWW